MIKTLIYTLFYLIIMINFTACSSNKAKTAEPVKTNTMTEVINTDCSKEENKQKSGCNM